MSLLIEKYGDNKDVVRDMVQECCSSMIKHTKPFVFANQICKNLQHSNCHVREGVLTLIVRSVIEQIKNEKNPKGSALKPQIPGASDSGLLSLTTNQLLIEEITFLVKVEDKKSLQEKGIDVLALLIAKSPQKTKTE